MDKNYIEFEVFVSTGIVGSQRSETIKIYNEELENLTNEEKENYIENACREVMFEMIDWGYESNE